MRPCLRRLGLQTPYGLVKTGRESHRGERESCPLRVQPESNQRPKQVQNYAMYVEITLSAAMRSTACYSTPFVTQFQPGAIQNSSLTRSQPASQFGNLSLKSSHTLAKPRHWSSVIPLLLNMHASKIFLSWLEFAQSGQSDAHLARIE